MTMLAKAKLIANQRVLLLSLCSLFIFAQVASSQHELEHSSHEYHATCDIFLHHAGNPSVCGDISAPDYYLPGALHYASVLSTAPRDNHIYVSPISFKRVRSEPTESRSQMGVCVSATCPSLA